MGNERLIFCFWESPTKGWHACKIKKHFHCLIICIYFYFTFLTLPYTLLFFQTPPLCDANRRWLVRFVSFHFIMSIMPDKAAFVSAVLLCVQRYRDKHYFYRSKRGTYSGKEWICIFIQRRKDQRDQHLKSTWNGLGFILKMTRFNDSESILSFERQ